MKKKKKEVRYSYALDHENRLVSILEAKSIDGVFRCPHCKSEMIKRCGENNAPHFAHKSKECDYDRYLHTLAEQKITEWFNSSNEVMIAVQHNVICKMHGQCQLMGHEISENCFKKSHDTYNLKKWLVRAEQEKSFTRNGEKYVADIFCHNQKNPQNPLFLEIHVTHRCEQKKKDSGIKIIEFDIQSEEDIDAIIGQTIMESEKIRFYNFENKESEADFHDRGVPVQKFILFPSMKAYVDKSLSCHDISTRRGLLEVTTLYNERIFDEGFYKVAMAYASTKFPVKDCSLCKYCKGNDDICCLYKKYGTQRLCRDNDANACTFFRKDEKLINERVNALEDEPHKDIWQQEGLAQNN